MIVPKNESKACDAVVRNLEKWTGKRRADVRYPEKDGNGPPVDLRVRLGAEEYAIEHTRIEPFENKIGSLAVANRITRHIAENIPDPVPSPSYYELQVPIDVSLPSGKAKMDRALNELVQWIRVSQRTLSEQNAGRLLPYQNPCVANHFIRETLAGFECKFELLQWPIARLIRRRPGALGFRLILPDDLERQREHRLRRAFSEKCPKLQACKTGGARTILVLESGDPSLLHFEFRGDLLPLLLNGCADPPDEIFLIETHTDPWWVWLIKRDNFHWPDTGMPELSCMYYDPDDSSLPGIPEWLATVPKPLRDALQLDRMYTPYSPGWAPATFDVDKLNGQTKARTATR